MNRTAPIRAATKDDAMELATLKRAEEDMAYRQLGTADEHELNLNKYCSPPYIFELIDARDTILLVGEAGGRINGMAAVTSRTDQAFLHALYVRNKRNGTGSRLVGAVAAIARELHRSHIRCEVFHENASAQAALEHLGFKPTGLRRPSQSYPQHQLLEFTADLSDALIRTHAETITLGSDIRAWIATQDS